MKNEIPFLSVVVPVYNVENYLEECVESILQQSFVDFELILVDDGATDASGRICEEFGKKDRRVRVIHKKNGGLVSARKAGVKAARGDYVIYVDGDDWIVRDMFRELCECALKEKTDIVIADFFCAYSDRKEPLTQNMRYGKYTKEELTESVYPSMLCSGEYFSFGFQPCVWGKIFRRELLYRNQLAVDERIKLGEDTACFYPCLLEADSIFYLKEHYLCYYRMRDTSISHSMISSYYTEEIMFLIDGLQKRFAEHEELLPILERQLYLYACYMLDNMFSVRLGVKTIFFSKELVRQMDIVAESDLGRNLISYCSEIRTSSRMKRVFRLMRDRSLKAKVNLYLFWKYERLKSGFDKIFA
ncbi:MAG: glycosyltransferase [Lachnospiraceae bacterium]|nr:glycosyltransferase [Lachnospiraceae bacterium]